MSTTPPGANAIDINLVQAPMPSITIKGISVPIALVGQANTKYDVYMASSTGIWKVCSAVATDPSGNATATATLPAGVVPSWPLSLFAVATPQ